jgi:hypothetical protein
MERGSASSRFGASESYFTRYLISEGEWKKSSSGKAVEFIFRQQSKVA